MPTASPTRADQKAAFDTRVAGRRARVASVHDLRPWDPDLGCRLPITADECNVCERCGAVHPVVWTVDVDGVGPVLVGQRCALHSMGIHPGGRVKVLLSRELLRAEMRSVMAAAVRCDVAMYRARMACGWGDPRVGDAGVRAEAAAMVVRRLGEPDHAYHGRLNRVERLIYDACGYMHAECEGRLDAWWQRRL